MKWLLQTFFTLLLCTALWVGGLFWFIAQIPTQPAADPHGELIVVLTGGPGRLDYGLQLLAERHAQALFVSGVSKGVTVRDIMRQASVSTQEKLARTQVQPIFLGSHAVNTIGNADETRHWLADKPYQSLILVTSSYHMPRSLSEFREVLPEIAIVPAPVFASDFNIDAWTAKPESQRLLFSEYHKYIASKLRHWFVSATQSA